MARQGDIGAEAELAAIPELPAEAAYLWRWFFDLSETRQNTGMGIGRLSRLEIRQWEADQFVDLSHWERHTLLELDRLFVTAQDAEDEAGEVGA